MTMKQTGATSDTEAERQIQAVCDAGKSETPICDAAECEIIPSADPNYDGPHLWVESHIARALEKETARLREALFRMCCAADELLADTQHKTHDCGDEGCPVDGMRAQLGHARALLSPASTADRAGK